MSTSAGHDPDLIATEIAAFLEENILAEGVQATPDTDLAGLGVDSFSLMEIVLFIERRFEFLMPMEELTPETIASIRSLSLRLHELMQQAG